MSNFLLSWGNRSELVSGIHPVFLYSQEEYFITTAALLFRAGFNSQEKCFFLGDSSFVKKIKEKLDLIKFEEPSGDEDFADEEKKKSFSEEIFPLDIKEPARVIPIFQDIIQKLEGEPFKNARFIVHTDWLFQGAISIDNILLYEKEISSFLDKNNSPVIDCYKSSSLSGSDMIKLFTCHDGVLVEGEPSFSYFTNFKELALKDILTGLYNERYLLERISEEIFRAKRFRSSCSLMMMKIEKLDEIKITCGQNKFEQICMEFSSLLRNSLRRVDLIATARNDCFVVLMPETSKKRAVMIGERIQKVFEQKLLAMEAYSGINMFLKTGISNFPLDTRDAEELTVLAEEALSDAMKDTGHRICLAHRDNDWFPPLD
ncbi:MAG: diguanylate cyclase [Candidatus Eremiobacterota bacterium]